MPYLEDVRDQKKNYHFMFVMREPSQLTWLAEVLSELIEKNSPLTNQIRIYLTQLDMNKLTNSAQIFLKLLKGRVQILEGRPDILLELRRFQALYEVSTFHVYSCGPSQLNKKIGKACSIVSKPGKRLDFFYETY